MTKMNYAQQSDLLAGHIGLLKMELTRTEHLVADSCMQIWGGRGITRGGMGGLIEVRSFFYLTVWI